MNLYETYETDQGKETDGAWVRDFRPGLHLKICRIPNPAYNQLFAELIAPHRIQFDNNTLDEGVLKAIVTRCLAETVLVGWEGVQGKGGEEIPYSAGAARKLMTDLPDFREDVAALGRNRELFRSKEEDADQGNSEKSSAGD